MNIWNVSLFCIKIKKTTIIYLINNLDHCSSVRLCMSLSDCVRISHSIAFSVSVGLSVYSSMRCDSIRFCGSFGWSTLFTSIISFPDWFQECLATTTFVSSSGIWQQFKFTKNTQKKNQEKSILFCTSKNAMGHLCSNLLGKNWFENSSWPKVFEGYTLL